MVTIISKETNSSSFFFPDKCILEINCDRQMSLYVISVFISIFKNNNEVLIFCLCTHRWNSHSTAGSWFERHINHKGVITAISDCCLGMFLFIFPNIQPQSELRSLLLEHLNINLLVTSWPFVYDRQQQLALQVAADSDTESWIFPWPCSVSCGRERRCCCYIPQCQELWAMLSDCTLFRLFPEQFQKKLLKFGGGQPEAISNPKLHEWLRLRRS